MQLRYETGLTGEQYIRAEAWRDARLERCPNHPHGSCSFARHGTYTRKTPRGTHIARWYCRESHTTFSLLPDCLAARLPGELDTLEAVVAHAEHAASLATAANELRRDAVELPGAMRWVERRVRLVHHVLSIVVGLLPDLLARCVTEVGAVRTRLETETALRTLRRLTGRKRRYACVAASQGEPKVSDLHVGRSDSDHGLVTLHGKGNKRRQCPLWPRTERVLAELVDGRATTDSVFLSRYRKPFTRFGVYRLVERCALRVPVLAGRKITPHVVRHSTACSLLRAGVDLNTIRAWLGHVSLNTTNIYAEIDLDTKAKAMALCEAATPEPDRPWKEDKGLIAFLKSL